MMFANLLGIKPAEIKEAVEQTMGAIKAGADDMKEIKQRLARIEQYLLEGSFPNGRRELISDHRSAELNGTGNAS